MPANPAAPEADEIYRCGTLTYTKMGLFSLFSWLIWGKLCFDIFEDLGGFRSSTGPILGLYLQENFHASNLLVHLLFSIIPMLIGMVIGPIISFKSDRYRSRFGRRIPFMFVTIPFLCFFAFAIGYSDEIISFLKAHANASAWISPMAASLTTIGFLVIGFTFFNEFVGTVYWYLFADVVPPKLIGRFNGLTMVMTYCFHFVVYTVPVFGGVTINGAKLTHMKAIHVGVSLLYFVGFGLMCLRVKEGKYPPVTDVTEKTSRWDQVKLYFRESFTHPIFIWFYVFSAAYAFSIVGNLSGVFFLHMGQHQGSVLAHSPTDSSIAVADPSVSVFRNNKPDLSNNAVIVIKPSKGSKLPAPLKPMTTLYVVNQTETSFQLSLVPNGPPIKIASGGEISYVKTSPTLIAATQDEKRLVTGSADGIVKIWERSGSKDLALLKEFQGDGGSILSVAISPDGKTTISGSLKGQIEILNVENGSRSEKIAGHKNGVLSLAFSPDGSQWVSSGADHLVKIWDTKSKKCVRSLTGHEDAVNSVAFSSDGKRIVSGGSDRAIILWDAQNGTLLKKLEGSTGPVYSVCFAPALEKIEQRKMENRSIVDRVTGVVSGYFKDVFSNDSLYDIPANERSRNLGEDLWVISGGRDGKTDEEYSDVHLWSVAEGKILMNLKGHKKAISSVLYKPDLRAILSGSLDGSIRYWDPVEISQTATDQSFKTFSGYTSGVTSFVSEMSGKIMINASNLGKLHLWNIDEGISLRKIGISSGFTSLIALLLAYPFGALVDRFSPVRIIFWTTVVLVPIQMLPFFFMHDYLSYFWTYLPRLPFNALTLAVSYPLAIALFPRTKFGQMCSANSVVKQSSQSVLALVGAVFYDWVTNYSLNTDGYRYGYLWITTGALFQALALFMVYYHWKKLGGNKYVPPEVK